MTEKRDRDRHRHTHTRHCYDYYRATIQLQHQLAHTLDAPSSSIRLCCDEIQTSEGEQSTVSDISVHDTEKERESSCSEEGRVSLSVSGDTVRVYELLECVRVLVYCEVGGGCGPTLGDFLHHSLR